MRLETSRRALSSALRRVGVCFFAERVDIPNLLSADLAGDGFDSRLHADLERARSFAAAGGLLVYQPAPGVVLLRAVSGGRLERGLLCFRAGTQGTMAAAVVAVPPALLLSPGDVLRHGQVSHYRRARRRGWLGQARAKSDRRSATVKWHRLQSVIQPPVTNPLREQIP